MNQGSLLCLQAKILVMARAQTVPVRNRRHRATVPHWRLVSWAWICFIGKVDVDHLYQCAAYPSMLSAAHSDPLPHGDIERISQATDGSRRRAPGQAPLPLYIIMMC